MKMLITISLFCVVICIGCSSTNGSIKGKKFNDTEFTPSYKIPEVTAEYYSKAVNKLKSEGVTAIDSIDFVKFRYGYLLYSEDKSLFLPPELETGLKTAVQDKNYRLAIAFCDSILNLDFTNIRAHMFRGFALKSLGEDFSFNRKMMLKIENSILSSGDGKTPETAFHVSQIDEEYYIVSSLGLTNTSQGLIFVGDHAFDVMECENESGKPTSLYFDVTEHMTSISNYHNKNKEKK